MVPPVPRLLTAAEHADLDGALRRRFHEGDPLAFELLVEPHLDTLYTVCLRLMGNRTAAEDVAQDALVKALDRCHRYDPDRAFRPWLLTVACNLCRDRLRSVWWKRVLPLDDPLHDRARTPEQQVGQADLDAKVRRALAELPPLYREALSLFHLDDMSYREMSEVTGCSVPALKQRVRRGAAMLREVLEALYPEAVAERMKD